MAAEPTDPDRLRRKFGSTDEMRVVYVPPDAEADPAFLRELRAGRRSPRTGTDPLGGVDTPTSAR